MIKFNLVLLILTISTIHLFSQSWEWANSYKSSGNTNISSIEENNDGDIFISGFIPDTTIFGNDTLNTFGLISLGFIAKLTSGGNSIWVKPTFNDNGVVQSPSSGNYISIASNNSIIVSGKFRDSLVFGNNTLYEANGGLFISLLDSEGNIQWVKNFGDSSPSGSNAVQPSENHLDGNDNIYLIGTFHDTAYFETDTLYWQEGKIFIVKFDENGNEKWVRQCGKSGGWQRGYDITSDSFGNVYLTGTIPSGESQFGTTIIETPFNRNNTYISKLDSLGNFVWTITGGANNDFIGVVQLIPSTYGTNIKTDGTNNVYFTGFFTDTVQFGNDLFYPSCGNQHCQNFFLASYDLDGNFNWFVQSESETIRSSGSDVEVDEEGNLYIAGLFRDEIKFNNLNLVSSISANNPNDLFVAKFTSLGECIGIINSNTNTYNPGIALSCLNQSIHIGSYFKGESGNLSALGVTESPNISAFVGSISNSFDCEVSSNTDDLKDNLFSVFPNPFKDQFQINFSQEDFHSDQFINVRIYNSIGQLVYTSYLNNETITIDCSHLGKGFYYIQLFDSNGKMMTNSIKGVKMD